MGTLQTITITIPCYNEAARLELSEFSRLLSGDSRISLLFVDDGSADETGVILREYSESDPTRISVLALPENRGKAEAVRAGLNHSLESNPDAIGYIDADLATPVDEVLRLVREMTTTEAGGILGSRVATLGANVQRNPARHYLGRIFASMASLALSTSVYDTQCGAKLFRNSPGMAASLEEPFLSRWAFDVELLGRLLSQGVSIVEVPLREWQDVAGSKMRVSSMAKAGLDLVRIGIRLRRQK